MLKSLFFASAALFLLGGCGESADGGPVGSYVINNTTDGGDTVALIYEVEGEDEKIIALDGGTCVSLDAAHFANLKVELDHNHYVLTNAPVCEKGSRCSPGNYEIVDVAEVMFDKYEMRAAGDDFDKSPSDCNSFAKLLADYKAAPWYKFGFR